MSAAGDDELTAAICGLFGRALNITDVTAGEDFFELGGSSLQGATVIALIQRRLGRHVTLADLYEEPTAGGLAARLCDDRAASPPIFLVHFLPGDLAREIARRRPVCALSYVLSADGTDDGWPPPEGIEALASHYLSEMLRLRSVGPYYLVGVSRGGIIAWEMARQLTDSGAEVGLLCVIDTPPPEVRRRPLARRAVLTNLASTPPRALAQKGCRRLMELASRLEWVRWVRWKRADQSRRLDLIGRQLRDHRMRPFRGPLLLVEATERPQGVLYEPIPPLARAYEELGLVPDGYRLVQLAGNHSTVIADPLAADLAAAIDSAIVDGGSSG